jgi:hypothetical protein
LKYVFTQPQAMATAAADVAGIGSTIPEANAAAAGSTTSVAAAAGDEASAAISTLYGSHGHEYQALSAQTALFHDQFVQTLTSGGNAYNNTEAVSTNSMDSLDLAVDRTFFARHQLLGINPFAVEMFDQFRTDLGLYQDDGLLPDDGV